MRWSYSKLADYEKCPQFYRLRHVDRHPEPDSPAMLRGTKVHETVERYLLLRGALPDDLKPFQGYMSDIRQRPGLVVEEMWAMTRAWAPCNPLAKPAWWRGKLDAFWLDGTAAKVVDWKTGRMYPSNRDQMRLYAGAVMAREPAVERVSVELVYLDLRESVEQDYTREDFTAIRDDFTRRVAALEGDTKFALRPGKHCSWCAFAKSKGGPCSVG